jgi:PAP2 superfamily
MTRRELFLFFLIAFGIEGITLGLRLKSAQTFFQLPISSSTSSNRLVSFSNVRQASSSRGRPKSPITTSMSSLESPQNEAQRPKGFFNVVGASSKFFVSGLATVVLYSTDSWVPMYYIFGSVLNGVVSKCLKNIIRQPRPPQSDKGGYGMPSSHTQSFFFFLTALTSNSSRFLSAKLSALLFTAILVYSCAASYWRVVTGVHTFSQTVVGAVVGILFGSFVSRNEAAFLLSLEPFTRGYVGVPLIAKLFMSTAGALVICKSEVKLLLKLLSKRNLKKKRKD